MFDAIFKTKLCNDKTYKHNGEKVTVLYICGDFAKIKFQDGTTARVYITELLY